MMDFTRLERAVLEAIFDETPKLRDKLTGQLDRATVLSRENDGGGFFTTIAVGPGAEAIEGPGNLGERTHAHVEGLIHGLGFVLFLKNGRLDLLEGYAVAPEDTSALDFAETGFQLFEEPIKVIR
jgi:hypothetical protein